jgi:hypothetical protein
MSLHRMREGYKEERTACINRIRCVPAEFGPVFGKSPTVRKHGFDPRHVAVKPQSKVLSVALHLHSQPSSEREKETNYQTAGLTGRQSLWGGFGARQDSCRLIHAASGCLSSASD